MGHMPVGTKALSSHESIGSLRPSDAYMRLWTRPSVIQIMTCCLTGAKPLSDQCCDIVNWTPRNKLQWNLNQNLYTFIQENAFENVVWKIVAILSGPQCVKLTTTSWNSNFGAWFVSCVCSFYWKGLGIKRLIAQSKVGSFLIFVRYMSPWHSLWRTGWWG